MPAPIIEEYFWQADINRMTNAKIMEALERMFSHETLYYKDLRNESWWITEVRRLPGLIKSIDDEFVWYSSTLIRWDALLDIIVQELRLEEKLFVEWQTLKVISVMKLRNLWLGPYVQLAWQLFDCLWYEYLWTKTVSGHWSWLRVFVQDAFGNIYAYPQLMFTKLVRKIDIRKRYFENFKDTIIEQLEDKQKEDIEELSSRQATTLRDYMDASRNLTECITADIEKLANTMVNNSMNFEKKLLHCWQIKSAKLFEWQKIQVFTKMLFIDQDKTKPVGRFKIECSLDDFRLKIHNQDTLNNDEYQHPHVNRMWDCCFYTS